jgi:hypothetical protein
MNTTFPFDPAISICSPAPPGTRFDIGGCYNRTLGCSFFPQVPIHKCAEYCGSAFGYYEVSDVLQTFITWVIPLFALLANMDIARSTFMTPAVDWPWVSTILNHRLLQGLWNFIKSLLPKHFVYSVQLANPIGTIWSLADKLDLGQRLWDHFDNDKLYALHLGDAEKDRARRDIAHLCYCLDDFGYEKFEGRVNRLSRLLKMKDAGKRKRVYECVKETSRRLALIRTRNTRRTTVAVFVYAGAVVTSVLASTSSNGLDYSLPHTIALRELCFFLLAQVILSSAVGGWPQQWTPQDIMRNFAKQICEIDARPGEDRPFLWRDLAEKEIALWDGGSYVFRPQKKLYSSSVNRGDHSDFSSENGRLFLPCMAWFMVVVAFIVSFTMSFLTPTTGIGGRGLAEILYITVWTANFIFEYCITQTIRSRMDRRGLFTLIWLKDGIISLFVLLFFFLPFIGKPYSSAAMQSITPLFANLRPGWYNSCKSWSAWFSRWNSAYLDLNIGKTESLLLFQVYLVGAIVGSVAQVLMALIIVYIMRKAIGLSQRSDEENRTELCGDVRESTVIEGRGDHSGSMTPLLDGIPS